MSKKNDAFGFETRAIHAGASPDPVTGARSTPIYQTTSYVFDDVDHAASLFNLQTFGYIYSRITNPTVAVLEERVANLEGGRGAVACASGHAAQLLAFFSLMEPGAEFVSSRNLYGGSITQFQHTFAKFDWHVHFVDPQEPENFRKALTPKCKAIFAEMLTNPTGIVIDLEAIASIAHEAGIPFIVDNTLRLSLSLPAARVGCRHRRALDDEVPLGPRHLDGRHRRRVRASSTGARTTNSPP